MTGYWIGSIVGSLVSVVSVLCLDSPPTWLCIELGAMGALSGGTIGGWFDH